MPSSNSLTPQGFDCQDSSNFVFNSAGQENSEYALYSLAQRKWNSSECHLSFCGKTDKDAGGVPSISLKTGEGHSK